MNNLLAKIKNSTSIEKLLIINSLLFFIFLFAKSFFIQWFGISADFNALILKPWSVVSYAFFHHNFFHLFSNLLILYYIGSLFTTFFKKNQLLYLYFYGIVFSGFLFLLISYFLPSNQVLIGASGAVTALFVAVATRIPNYQIRLLLFGDVKLWILATIWVGLSLIQLTTYNYGGAIAHLGGAIMGYFYVYFQLDRFNWVDFLNFSSQKVVKKRTNLKTIYRKNNKTSSSSKEPKDEKQVKIDAILDKISKSGYDSLTQDEKTFLFNQGK